MLNWLKKLLGIAKRDEPRSFGVPASELPDRLQVSVSMVSELINIYQKRGFLGDPRVHVIGENLWQLGGMHGVLLFPE